MELIRRFLLGRIPAYVRRRAQHRRRSRRRHRATCSPTRWARSASATSSRAQLHPRPAVRRPRPDLGARARAGEAPGRARPLLAVELPGASGCRCRSRPTRCARRDCWWTYRNTKARKELGFEPRPHEETLEDAVRWQMEQLGDAGPDRRAGRRRRRWRAVGAAAARCGGRVFDAMSDGSSSCSTAARPAPTCCALAAPSRGGSGASGSSTATERLPYRRANRPGDRGADRASGAFRCSSTATRSSTTRSGSSNTWTGSTARRHG